MSLGPGGRGRGREPLVDVDAVIRTAKSYVVARQIVSDGANDPIRGAPQFVGPDSIERDLAFLRPARQLPELDVVRLGACQIVNSHLEDLVDLGLLPSP